MFEIYTSDHEACIRSAIGFMARGINVKRLQRGSLELDGPTSAKTALVWISDNTDSFVNATQWPPQLAGRVSYILASLEMK